MHGRKPWLWLSLACPSCALWSCWLWLGGKMSEHTWPQWPELMRNPECGTDAHSPGSISYQNTVHVHYELIWIRRLELKWLLYSPVCPVADIIWPQREMTASIILSISSDRLSLAFRVLTIRDYTTFFSMLSWGPPDTTSATVSLVNHHTSHVWSCFLGSFRTHKASFVWKPQKHKVCMFK